MTVGLVRIAASCISYTQRKRTPGFENPLYLTQIRLKHVTLNPKTPSQIVALPGQPQQCEGLLLTNLKQFNDDTKQFARCFDPFSHCTSLNVPFHITIALGSTQCRPTIRCQITNVTLGALKHATLRRQPRQSNASCFAADETK
jgi:hypothetical protein